MDKLVHDHGLLLNRRVRSSALWIESLPTELVPTVPMTTLKENQLYATGKAHCAHIGPFSWRKPSRELHPGPPTK